MKKKVQLIGVVLFGLIISSFAGSMYVGVNGGVSILNDSDISVDTKDLSYDTGYNIEGVFGYTFNAWRAELALNWQKNDLDKLGSYPITGDLTVFGGMLNGYYDFKAGAGFTPYLLAGLGVLNVNFEFNEEGVDDHDTVFAGQLGVGVGYAVTENIILDLKYKYLMSQDFEIVYGDIDVSLSGHQIQFGVRYQF